MTSKLAVSRSRPPVPYEANLFFYSHFGVCQTPKGLIVLFALTSASDGFSYMHCIVDFITTVANVVHHLRCNISAELLCVCYDRRATT